MDIELLDKEGEPFLVIADVDNAEEEFTSAYKDRYKAVSWREHTKTKRIEHVKELKVKEIELEASNRVMALDHSWTPEKHASKQISRVIKASRLLRKEQKGIITTKETEDLDLIEALSDTIEKIIEASDIMKGDIDGLNTVNKVESYNVAESGIWP